MRFLFQGTQKRVRNSRGKRAISVRATEVLLYLLVKLGMSKLSGEFRFVTREHCYQNVYNIEKGPVH